MDDTYIYETLIQILIELFKRSKEDRDVIENANLLEDLGMDSIAFITLVIKLEDAFGIEISDEWLIMEKFSTVEKIYSAITVATRIQQGDQ